MMRVNNLEDTQTQVITARSRISSSHIWKLCSASQKHLHFFITGFQTRTTSTTIFICVVVFFYLSNFTRSFILPITELVLCIQVRMKTKCGRCFSVYVCCCFFKYLSTFVETYQTNFLPLRYYNEVNLKFHYTV